MDSMAQTIRALGPIKLGLMAAAAVVMVSFFVFLTLRMSSPVMAPLYNELPMKDSSAIVSELEKRGIPYELRADGSQILVPSDNVLRLRMNMAEKGLPTGGSIVGYEIFDKSDAMGTSNFVLNLNMIRALEGELSRTIGSFQNIESARVHLVMPKRELFTREKEEPTASVAITMRGSSRLGKGEIAAISHVVATAVPGLQSNKITIVDSQGRLLAKGVGEGEEDSSYASDAQEYRINYERRTRDTIENLLASTLGADKIKAEVTADIGFDRVVTKSEKYDPESQVARSIQESDEQETSNEKDAGDTVSVANNLPDANKGGASGNESSHSTKRTDATTNFEISKEIRNQVSETGKVNRLSVAVLVDGSYTPDKEGKQIYSPRSPEELKQIATLVKSAIGFDEKRGDTVEVVNMQFSGAPAPLEDTGPLGWLQDDLHSIVQTLVIGGVAILAILLVIRPLVTRAIESTRTVPEMDEAEQAALNGPSISAQLTDQRFAGEGENEDDMINIDRIQGRVKSGSYRKISEAIDKHPDEALGVLRRWMMAA
jgi:flagellar M-ring protein FliF